MNRYSLNLTYSNLNVGSKQHRKASISTNTWSAFRKVAEAALASSMGNASLISLSHFLTIFPFFLRITANTIPPSLAYTSLYLGIAKVASSIDMDLFETTQQDIDVYHTRGFSFPKEGAGTVKVRVTGAPKNL